MMSMSNACKEKEEESRPIMMSTSWLLGERGRE
jgi:hypothetical protein